MLLNKRYLIKIFYYNELYNKLLKKKKGTLYKKKIFFSISQFLLIIMYKKKVTAIVDNKISGNAGPKPNANGIK